MTISSSFLLVILFPFLIFLPIYNKEKQDKNTIVGWFAALIIIAGLIFFVTWTSYFIPVIMNNPVWNYILNFIIHITFVTILSVILAKKTKTV
jgi:hypothetical protein